MLRVAWLSSILFEVDLLYQLALLIRNNDEFPRNGGGPSRTNYYGGTAKTRLRF